MDIAIKKDDIDIIIYFLKTYCMLILTYYIAMKSTNKSNDKSKFIGISLCFGITSIICTYLKYMSNMMNSTICLIVMLTFIFSKNTKSNVGYSIIVTIFSLSINYILYFIAGIFNFIFNVLINIQNDYITFIFLIGTYSVLVILFSRVKRFKKGLVFLQNNMQKDNIDILILNISVVILFAIIIGSEYREKFTVNIMIGLIVFSIIMFVTIQKYLQLYYKQKLLEQDLNETKDELAKRTKEVEELEAENISISKKSHTLAHKQKALEYKLQEIMLKTEISKEEVGELSDRIKEIGKDLYKEKTAVELDKTEIPKIDDMLEYMQSECTKNKIDFELQLKGNIHHMTNNLITIEDLETLLADHIKNAIIAINHTDNVNRSILVRLGKIDETYGLYIYDSGIEFEKETLENLGKKPSTTHASEGGTGMGFMNTFDTLNKCKASLTIEEYNEPSKDNYTKAIIIKFDGKNEFKIKSYRQNMI